MDTEAAGTSEGALWCVHAPGDDYIAVPSYAAGVRFAAEVLVIVEHDFPGAGLTATVVEWPLDATTHQRHLDEDRWPVDYDQHPPQLEALRAVLRGEVISASGESRESG